MKSKSVKEWYIKEFPTDELGHQINPRLTFNKIYNTLHVGYNLYFNLGVDDSLVRERVFKKLSELWKVNYNTIYNLWIDNLKEEKKNTYDPNGTKEEIKTGILHNINGYWVSNEGTKQKPNYHVWIPSVTHSVVDSAYNDITLAVARCNFIATY